MTFKIEEIKENIYITVPWHSSNFVKPYSALFRRTVHDFNGSMMVSMWKTAVMNQSFLLFAF